MDNRVDSVQEHVARARGFGSAAEMRTHFASKTEDDQHAEDLEMVRQIEREMRESAPHAPSIRSDVLSAELRTATTKAERRNAVNRFMAAQRPAEDVRFASWLRSDGVARAFENRAAGESATNSGGALVPTRFYADIIRKLKEYDGFLNAFEFWGSPHGEATNRPIAAAFNEADSQTENSAVTEGPYPTLTQQAWGKAPAYAASYIASNELVQDAFRYTIPANGWNPISSGNHVSDSWDYGVDGASAPFVNVNPATELENLVASALGESLGRVIAPVAQAALYAAITAQGAATANNSGGFLALTAATPVTFATGTNLTEFSQGTISLDTAAQMIDYLDAAYLATASWYFSTTAWSGILRQVDSNKHVQVNPSSGHRSLYDIPVVLTSQVSPATASTVSGVVLGDLSQGMTLRVARDSFNLLRSTERLAEFFQTYFRSIIRADCMARDARAVVGVKYAAS